MRVEKVNGNNNITVNDLFGELWASKWIVIVVTAVITSISVVYSYTAEPKYKSEVVIAASSKGQKSNLSMLAGNLSGLAGLAGINIGGGAGGLNKALAVLSSKVFISDFIESNNLLPILMHEYWDEQRGVWIQPKQPFYLSLFNEKKEPQDNWSPGLNAGVSRFIRNMIVEEDKKTSIITISISSHRRALVDDWANLLVVQLNERIRSREIIDLNKSISYLKEQLNQTNLHQMEQVIYSLLESQVQKIMLANVKDDYVFSVIDPAIEPSSAFKPKKQLIISLGFIMGVLLSTVFIVVRKTLKGK